MKDLASYQALPECGRAIVFFSVFLPAKHNAYHFVALLSSHFPREDVSTVARQIKDLTQLGFIRRYSSYERETICASSFSLAALRGMVAEADQKNWWPDAKTRTKALLAGYLPHSSVSEVNRFDEALTEGIRLFVVGAAKNPAVLREELAGRRGVELARSIAYWTCFITKEEPDFSFADKDDPRLTVIRYYLNVAFEMDRDVRKAMVALNTAIATFPGLSKPTHRMFVAIATWMGWREALKNPALDFADGFYQGCRALLDGDLSRAMKVFSPIDDAEVSSEERDLDNFPERLLQAMASAAENPEKIAKTKPAALLKGQGVLGAFWSNDRSPCRFYFRAQSRVAQLLGEKWKELVAGKCTALRECPDNFCPGALDALLLAWNWRLMPTGRAALRAKAAKVVLAAHCAADRGLNALALLLMTLLTGAFDAEAEKDFVAMLASRSFRFLLAVEPEPEWKGVLKVLKDVVKKARAAENRRKVVSHDRLIWRIALDEFGDDGRIVDIDDITLWRRSANAPESGEKDVEVGRYEWGRASIRNLMNDKDALLSNLLNDYYEVQNAEILRILCGMPNLELAEWKERRRYNRDRYPILTPMTISPGRCELESSIGEDGSVALKLPLWALSCGDDFVLRKTGEGTYAFIELTKDIRKFLSAFTDYGDKGRIVLPKEAMSEAGEIIEEMSDFLPLAAPSAEQASKLPRVEGRGDCCVRLDFAGETLSLKVIVYPIADNRSYFVDPGQGLAEKIVAGAAGSYLLVRNLDAERASCERIKTALAACESWFDGRSAWEIDDIAAALGALAALKALEPPVPMEWTDERRLKITNAPKSGVALSSRRTAEDWFSVKGEFKLDDGRVLSIIQLIEAMAAGAGNFARLSDGDYLYLTKAMVRQLAALRAAGRRKGDGLEIGKAAVPMLDSVFGEGDDSLELPDALAKTAEEIRAAFARKPRSPKTLKAELRPYQQDGFRWLSRLAACGFGACLADDMGLGKTVQVIAILLERAAGGASLVVAPSSVCGNWRRELERFAPTLNPVMALEKDVEIDSARANDVVIVSYGYLLFHEDMFVKREWNGVVLDEAQAIKNDASKRAKLVKRFNAKFRIAATGTPVENRLGELWSLFDFLNPGLLGPAASFTARFTGDDGRASPELKRLVKPLILRRLKSDVLDDLPEKTEVTIPVELGTAERTAYEACRRHALAALAEQKGEVSRMTILAELTRLRRFCCHPSLVLGSNEVPSAKLEALMGILEGLHLANHRALVFSQFTDYLAIVRKAISSRGWSCCYLDGATPTLERERLVNAFQSGEGDFFLISLKAGGTGLNLTAANYVILLDPWWNPAVENQAADRAHRIGQKNPVTVYRLISSDTVEERVLELHKEKKALAEDVLDGTGKSALSPEMLMRLFG